MGKSKLKEEKGGKMNINIEKRHLYILVGLIILATVGYVIAQTPGVSHHPGEIEGGGLVVGGGTYSPPDMKNFCFARWGEARCDGNTLTCNTGRLILVAEDGETDESLYYLCII